METRANYLLIGIVTIAVIVSIFMFVLWSLKGELDQQYAYYDIVFEDAVAGLNNAGDVLFQGSIGRTDLPRGDYQTLVDSITTRLWPLADEVQFIPGHGPMSTFGDERRSNPFVSDLAAGV